MRHQKVRDIMTADPVTVTSATPLKYVAAFLVKQKVSAVPVLSLRGKLLGVVSETDLLRKEELQRDPDSRHSLHLNYRARRDLATNPALVHVEVSDGVVRLAGELERKSMLTRIWPAIRAVDGVIDVDGDLGYAFDDTRPPPAPERDESPLTRGTHPPIAARRLT